MAVFCYAFFVPLFRLTPANEGPEIGAKGGKIGFQENALVLSFQKNGTDGIGRTPISGEKFAFGFCEVENAQALAVGVRLGRVRPGVERARIYGQLLANRVRADGSEILPDCRYLSLVLPGGADF